MCRPILWSCGTKPRNLVRRYKGFRETHCLHHRGCDWGSSVPPTRLYPQRRIRRHECCRTFWRDTVHSGHFPKPENSKFLQKACKFLPANKTASFAVTSCEVQNSHAVRRSYETLQINQQQEISSRSFCPPHSLYGIGIQKATISSDNLQELLPQNKYKVTRNLRSLHNNFNEESQK
jgi:hypothetical protein